MPGGDPADVYDYDGGDVLRLLTARRPPWMRDAACREHNGRQWFPALGQQAALAKTVCAGCLVRAECLAYALEQDERDGVWGGTTPRERQALRRKAG